MGIALLPVAAGVSVSPEEPAEAMQGRTILPKGVLMVARAVKRLLEVVEDYIFSKKKKFGGGGLVWFL